MLVHPTGTALELRREVRAPGDVGRPDRAAQPIVCRIGKLEGVVDAREWHHGKRGAELLLVHKSKPTPHVADDRGCEPVSVTVGQ